MNGKNLFIAAVLALGLIAVLAWANNREAGSRYGVAGEQGRDQAMENIQPQERTFTVIGRNFSFSPGEIRVRQGDKVRVVFANEQGFHDWVVDEFNARTGQINAGQTDEVVFIADRMGTFEYYCSVGSHRQMGMAGKLVVE